MNDKKSLQLVQVTVLSKHAVVVVIIFVADVVSTYLCSCCCSGYIRRRYCWGSD